MMIRFILLVFTLTISVFFIASGAYACTGNLSLPTAARQADAVFIGKMVTVENVKLTKVGSAPNSPTQKLILFAPEMQKLTFEVSQSIKNISGNTLEVLYEPICSSKLANGRSEDFVIFAYKWAIQLYDESLLSEENRLKQIKLKTKADTLNEGLPSLMVFAIPLSNIKANELKLIKDIDKASKK